LNGGDKGDFGGFLGIFWFYLIEECEKSRNLTGGRGFARSSIFILKKK